LYKETRNVATLFLPSFHPPINTFATMGYTGGWSTILTVIDQKGRDEPHREKQDLTRKCH